MKTESVFNSVRSCRTIEHLNRLDTWLQHNATGDDVLTELSMFVEHLLTKHKLFLYDEELKNASTMWVANDPFEPSLPEARDSDYMFLPDAALTEIRRTIPSGGGFDNSDIISASRRLTRRGKTIRDRFGARFVTLHTEDEALAEKIFSILNAAYMRGNI